MNDSVSETSCEVLTNQALSQGKGWLAEMSSGCFLKWSKLESTGPRTETALNL